MTATVTAALECPKCRREWTIHKPLDAASTRSVGFSLIAENCAACPGFAPIVRTLRFHSASVVRARHGGTDRAFGTTNAE